MPVLIRLIGRGAYGEVWLGRLADVPSGKDRAKAEAVDVLSRDSEALRVLVMFDGIQNGGPQEYLLRY